MEEQTSKNASPRSELDEFCPSLMAHRSALSVSGCLESGGGWLAEWEARTLGPTRESQGCVAGSVFNVLRGWDEVQRSKHCVRRFDEASECHEWDLASMIDTEEASVAADSKDQEVERSGAEVKELDELFAAIYPLIRQYELEHASPGEHKVVEYLPASDLASAVNLALPLEGSSSDFIQACHEILRYSVRTSHPRFMNQLFAGSEPSGQVAELLTSVVNNSVHTYGAAPLATVVEQYLIEQVGRLADFSEADGIFCPGGSFANMGAMLVARNELFPHVQEDGWQGSDRPVVFTSAHAHYSIKKAAMMLGIGMNNCILVPADSAGAMQPQALEALIIDAKSRGKRPFFVSCTAGTTVTGSFDPLQQIVDVCRKHGLWVHADGAWGGAVIFSDAHRWPPSDIATAYWYKSTCLLVQKYYKSTTSWPLQASVSACVARVLERALTHSGAGRGLVEGLGRCDSFCFNPHKLLGVSSQVLSLLDY